MQFYFIRHAQSTNNALWLKTSSSKGRSEDPGLSETGQQQAHRLAHFLKVGDPSGGSACEEAQGPGFGITNLYCSLMIRSVETGVPISKALGVRLMAWEELHEEGGIYLEDETSGEPVGLPGYSSAYFREKYPGLVLPPDIIESGWWNRRPMEELEEARLRAQNFLASLLDKHGESDDRVAAISHGGFYFDFLVALLKLPNPENLWVRMNNAAVTRIDFIEGRADIIYSNRMDFLPSELIT